MLLRGLQNFRGSAVQVSITSNQDHKSQRSTCRQTHTHTHAHKHLKTKHPAGRLKPQRRGILAPVEQISRFWPKSRSGRIGLSLMGLSRMNKLAHVELACLGHDRPEFEFRVLAMCGQMRCVPLSACSTFLWLINICGHLSLSLSLSLRSSRGLKRRGSQAVV